MAPSVDPNTANFYVKLNFEGQAHPYPIHDANVQLPASLNDRFLSVNVGAAAKVIAWQHYSSTGIYREWTGENPDITDIGGLSTFRVVDGNTRAISFLFKDATGAPAKRYSLQLNAADVGSVKLYSNEDETYRLVGIMPDSGPPVTTAVYVRDESSGVYITQGSVFFQWNSSDNRTYRPLQSQTTKDANMLVLEQRLLLPRMTTGHGS
jgi:hypothetical protein